MSNRLSNKEKRVCLRSSAAVVSITSFSGGRLFFVCSGTIIECEEVADGSYVSTILTTASLVRCSTCYIPSLMDSNTIPDAMKFEVRSIDGSLFQGDLVACDFHFNIAVVNIKSHAMHQTLKVRHLDDSVSVYPLGSDSTYQNRPHSELFQIRRGDRVLILGRHFSAPYFFDAYSGTFSIDRKLDCREVFTTNSEIPKCCVGGPIVNQHGELIGIAFGGPKCNPFLPVNIASMCLEYFKRYGKFSRPYVGMYLFNICAARIYILEKFLRKFRGTSKGVFVERVLEDSPAHRAGILEDDVIVGCNGSSIGSYLEFKEKIFDKVGESVELLVLRASNGAALNLSLVVNETSPDDFYRWPLRQPRRSIVKGMPMTFCCCHWYD